MNNDMVLHTSTMPIRIAREITQEFYITQPSHIAIEEIAAYRGVLKRLAMLEGCDARLVLNSKHKTGIATINSTIPEEGRRRFALAHELGHFELHRKNRQIWNCTEFDFLKWYHSNEEEPEANAFAAELLMPEELFRKQTIKKPPGFASVKELLQTFNTSLTATAVRYVEKGNHPCALISSSGGKISWFRRSHDFYHPICKPGSKVLPYSCAGDYFSNGNKPPHEPVKVRAFCWLENSNPNDMTILYEEAIAMPNYGTVLSLIWEE
jgi:Zn-dependent peptidase ImmA (M78 family)